MAPPAVWRTRRRHMSRRERCYKPTTSCPQRCRGGSRLGYWRSWRSADRRPMHRRSPFDDVWIADKTPGHHYLDVANIAEVSNGPPISVLSSSEIDPRIDLMLTSRVGAIFASPPPPGVESRSYTEAVRCPYPHIGPWQVSSLCPVRPGGKYRGARGEIGENPWSLSDSSTRLLLVLSTPHVDPRRRAWPRRTAELLNPMPSSQCTRDPEAPSSGALAHPRRSV
jgi:hypothetical protein